MVFGVKKCQKRQKKPKVAFFGSKQPGWAQYGIFWYFFWKIWWKVVGWTGPKSHVEGPPGNIHIPPLQHGCKMVFWVNKCQKRQKKPKVAIFALFWLNTARLGPIWEILIFFLNFPADSNPFHHISQKKKSNRKFFFQSKNFFPPRLPAPLATWRLPAPPPGNLGGFFKNQKNKYVIQLRML